MRELAAGWRGAVSNVAGQLAPRHAIAIPVRNEAGRILACIDALAAQRDRRGQPLPFGQVHLVLLLNNCSDASRALIEARAARWPIAMTACEVALPDTLGHAGYARRLVNHLALRDLHDDGVLFMTDADSRVPAHWIAHYTGLIDGGCDAVAGMADMSPDDHADIPASLMQRSALEDRYAALLDELESLLDPVAHDPWPRHYAASGANMAVRAGALRMLGDFPQLSCGEDRALIAMLERADCRVRHDTHTRVLTSGRLFGRAMGGKADTLRHRIAMPEALCDVRLQSVRHVYRRASLRAALRHARQQALPSAINQLAAEAGVAPRQLQPLLALPSFGKAWSQLQSRVRDLQAAALPPFRLPQEINRCRVLIEHLRAGQPTDIATRNPSHERLAEPSVAFA